MIAMAEGAVIKFLKDYGSLGSRGEGVEMSEESSFTVRDRRSSSSEPPEGKAEPAETLKGEKPTEKKESVAETAGPYSRTEKEEHEAHHIPVNFASFILSLATSAFIHLGEEADPATGRKSVELTNARQVIDLIALLEEKTQGNLSKEEDHLLKELLYTLRMKFVALEKNRRA